MKIEWGLLSRFMLKLNYWNIKNENKKITQVFERATTIILIFINKKIFIILMLNNTTVIKNIF